jgi:enediyne biosynthesis protein E4
MSQRRRSRRSFLETAALEIAAGAALRFGIPVRAYAATADPFQSPIAPGSPLSVSFKDVAREAGLGSVCVFGGEKAKKWIIETTGCGIAFLDYDNDGWLDIFQVNGTTLEGSPGHQPSNHLYKNNRDGTFTDVTASAGLTRTGWGQGVCIGDYDNDGWDDLFVTYWGQNVLYRNNRDGTFTDVTKQAGLIQTVKLPRWNTGCCFVDYDRDGFLDLFVANYVDLDLNSTPAAGSGPFCQWKGIPVMCGPRGLPAGLSILYRNNRDGTFTDVSEESGVRRPTGHYGFTALTGDFDNDGWPDIYVACDSTPSILFHNNHDGTFTDIAVKAGCAFNDDGKEQAGMGAAAGDYDCDGSLDIFKTNFSDDTATLYRNDGRGFFRDATFESGLGRNTQYLGWGCGFIDIDNDGWVDIFQANGHVYPELESAGVDVPFRERKLLYRNLRNGRFEDISDRAGKDVSVRHSARGVAFGDFDNDGDVDILINNIHDPPVLLRNDGGNQNRWLLIKVEGTRSNRSGIGARVIVKVGAHQQLQEVRSGGSYLSQSDLRLHFGLGRADRADVIEVRWPSGTVDRFTNVATNQILQIKEGKSSVTALPR